MMLNYLEPMTTDYTIHHTSWVSQSLLLIRVYADLQITK